ncbi:Acetyl-CoA acetyltransferase, cytosolic 1 [Senna tora]|uniref:Acetyl-CoA acetyltransferase, cytosolic 1 n=1 Tax=Senna tora TaxID=362788 RepID=A0A834XA17_9FABA|nr:Acetyl-CoA acetyltransferase, cytosolic 1 [Senna tora]
MNHARCLYRQVGNCPTLLLQSSIESTSGVTTALSSSLPRTQQFFSAVFIATTSSASLTFEPGETCENHKVVNALMEFLVFRKSLGFLLGGDLGAYLTCREKFEVRENHDLNLVQGDDLRILGIGFTFLRAGEEGWFSSMYLPDDSMSPGPYPVKPRDICVVGVARTPIGGFLGTLSSLSATELGSIAIKASLKRANIDPSLVQEVFFGNVLTANLGQAPARQAALGAGIPTTVICTTINKVCSAGVKATMLAAQTIQLGIHDVVVAGGMESMSNAPKYIAEARKGSRLGHDTIIDGMIKDGLWDVYNDFSMGVCGELCAEQHVITRDEQDSYAIKSFERGISAQNSGHFTWEIVPVEVSGGKGKPSTLIDKDEGLGKFDAAKLRKLRPSFKDGGSVTAGNASSIRSCLSSPLCVSLHTQYMCTRPIHGPGSGQTCLRPKPSGFIYNRSALVLVSGEKALQLGLQVIAKIKGYADAAQAPELFTTAPALAIPKAISNAGLEASQIDYYEINEAFSVVALANQKLLGLNPDKVNVHGGAVSLGHPLGCSGARILVTLLGVLRQKNGKYGVGAICNGGGGASALVFELV